MHNPLPTNHQQTLGPPPTPAGLVSAQRLWKARGFRPHGGTGRVSPALTALTDSRVEDVESASPLFDLAIYPLVN